MAGLPSSRQQNSNSRAQDTCRASHHPAQQRREDGVQPQHSNAQRPGGCNEQEEGAGVGVRPAHQTPAALQDARHIIQHILHLQHRSMSGHQTGCSVDAITLNTLLACSSTSSVQRHKAQIKVISTLEFMCWVDRHVSNGFLQAMVSEHFTLMLRLQLMPAWTM